MTIYPNYVTNADLICNYNVSELHIDCYIELQDLVEHSTFVSQSWW